MPPARHYSQLIVWKLANEIRIEVFNLTEKSNFAADLRARSQAEDAANSMGRNIAEGFGCETHAEFARYLEIARRSLNELHDILHGARLKKYVTTAELAAIRRLSHRLYPAFSRFIAYLKRTPNVRPRRGTPDHRDRPGENRTRSRTPPSPVRTDHRGSDRTDKRRQEIRTDERQRTRTNKRKGARTDKNR
jgi:four helix bundle protein